MNLHKTGWSLIGIVLTLGLCVHAEDTNTVRPYLQIRYGEFDSKWGSHDLWGIGVGANLNQHWGVELSAEAYQRFLEDSQVGKLGEETTIALMPQVRLRYPLFHNRLVPYVIAGGGPAIVQFNDRVFDGKVEGDGVQAAFTAGGGLDYFIADNIALNLEGKYLWVDPLDITVNGQSRQLDVSSALATIGLRIYFRENRPRVLIESEEKIPTRLYFGMRFGGSVLADDQFAPGLKLTPVASANGGSVNKAGSLALGANFGEHWGAEILLDYTEHRLAFDSIGSVGEYAEYSAIVQPRFRWPLADGRWVPYATAGLGMTYAEFNDGRLPPGTILHAKGASPAATVGGGVEYFVARNFSVDGNLSWLHTWNQDIELNGVTQRGAFSVVMFQLGFRVYLKEW